MQLSTVQVKAVAQLTFTICCSCVGSTNSSSTSRVTCFLFVAFDMTQRVPFERHTLTAVHPPFLAHLRNNFWSSLARSAIYWSAVESKGLCGSTRHICARVWRKWWVTTNVPARTYRLKEESSRNTAGYARRRVHPLVKRQVFRIPCVIARELSQVQVE